MVTTRRENNKNGKCVSLRPGHKNNRCPDNMKLCSAHCRPGKGTRPFCVPEEDNCKTSNRARMIRDLGDNYSLFLKDAKNQEYENTDDMSDTTRRTRGRPKTVSTSTTKNNVGSKIMNRKSQTINPPSLQKIAEDFAFDVVPVQSSSRILTTASNKQDKVYLSEEYIQVLSEFVVTVGRFFINYIVPTVKITLKQLWFIITFIVIGLFNYTVRIVTSDDFRDFSSKIKKTIANDIKWLTKEGLKFFHIFVYVYIVNVYTYLTTKKAVDTTKNLTDVIDYSTNIHGHDKQYNIDRDTKNTVTKLILQELDNGNKVSKRSNDVITTMTGELSKHVNKALESPNIRKQRLPFLSLIEDQIKVRQNFLTDIKKGDFNLKKVSSSEKKNKPQHFLTKIKKGDFSLRKVPSSQKNNKPKVKKAGFIEDIQRRNFKLKEVSPLEKHKKAETEENQLLKILKKRRANIDSHDSKKSSKSQSSEWN